MKLPWDLAGQEVVKALRKLGYEKVRPYRKADPLGTFSIPALGSEQVRYEPSSNGSQQGFVLF